MSRRKRYSARDRDVWIATYAAAFVDQFRVAYNVVRNDPVRPSDEVSPFDRALAHNAETAITIADAAVDQLREWEKGEGKVGP